MTVCLNPSKTGCVKQLSSIHLLSHVQLFVTPGIKSHQASMSITNTWSLFKITVIDLVMPSNHLILCVPFSSRLQSFPASGSIPVSQLFASGGQSIGVSASASVLPMNIQDWFPLGWTGWNSLQFKGLSRVFSNTTVQKHQFYGSALFMVQLSHPYMTTGKIITLTMWSFVGKVMSLIFNMLSRLVIAFLPRSKHLLMSWLQSPSAVIFRAQENKVCHYSHCFPRLFAMKWWDQMPWSSFFE